MLSKSGDGFSSRESHHGQPGGWERTTCTRNMSSVSLLVTLIEPSPPVSYR